jgi:hypothetical protein
MTIIDSAAVGVRPRSRTRHRLLIAATTVFGTIGLTAEPAFAAQTCPVAPDSIVCSAINQIDNGLFAVHVGIDVRMSLAEAQEYVDDPGDTTATFVSGLIVLN